MQALPSRDYWPTLDWKTALPQEMGFDTAALAQAHKYIDAYLPGLHSLLIVRHGYLVSETYYQGFHRDSYHNLASVTKSIISALIGVVLGENKLASINQPLLDFFPDHASRETDARKQAITLRHLLNFTAGFSQEFPHEYWLSPVRLALERPMVYEPGEIFYYDSQGVDILSGILTLVTGMSAAAYADATLFKTLGIWRDAHTRFLWRNEPDGAHTWHGDALWDEKDGYPWKVDPQGYSTGSFGAHMTARSMAKFGYLFLNHGYWDGIQVLPEDYVLAATRQQSAGGPPVNLPYGYLWWIDQDGTYPAFFASGHAGRLIYVVPALDLVVVTTASTAEARRHPLQTREITEFVRQVVVQTI